MTPFWIKYFYRFINYRFESTFEANFGVANLYLYHWEEAVEAPSPKIQTRNTRRFCLFVQSMYPIKPHKNLEYKHIA